MDHKDLDVWKLSINLVKEIYGMSNLLPKEELFGITSQIKRCSVSIPSNIAEGCARNSKKELIQFLYIALGSSSELETHLVICLEIGYITEDIYNNINNKLLIVRKMLINLIKSLKNH